MDVFYYWKNHEQDIKSGRLGHFDSTSEKLQEMADGQPEFIWVFKTPPGRKGELQLLGRLRWRAAPTKGFHREAGHFYIHYDSVHADSQLYVDSGSETALAATSHWVAHHFANMRSAGFKGQSAQEALRGQPLKDLKAIAGGLSSRPLTQPADVAAPVE